MRSSCANAAEMTADGGTDGVGVAHRRLVCGGAPRLGSADRCYPVVLAGAVVRSSVLLAVCPARHQPGAGVAHRQTLFGGDLHGLALVFSDGCETTVPH